MKRTNVLFVSVDSGGSSIYVHLIGRLLDVPGELTDETLTRQCGFQFIYGFGSHGQFLVSALGLTLPRADSGIVKPGVVIHDGNTVPLMTTIR